MWMLLVACNAAPDPALEEIQQALQNEDQNPSKTYQILSDNLDVVKDKRVIEVLLSYLMERIKSDTGYNNIDSTVAFYLERVTGLKSHMDWTFAGPVYTDKEIWRQDLQYWWGWWKANKDYIYWDEQAQALKVKPH